MSVTTVALGEVATLQAGIGFPPALQGRSEGDFPFAKVGDISRCGRSECSVLSTADHYIDESDVAQLRAKPVPAGSVLFAKIGEAIRQNHRVMAGRPLLIDNNAMAAIPSERIDSRFLYHYLKTVDFYALAPATTVPALRKSELEGIRVPFFPLEEQRRIAAILDRAETLRTQRRTALALLDSLTQSLFLDMFGDPATNSRKWPVKRLKDLGQVITGGTPPSSKEGMFDGPIPFITPGDLESEEPVRRSVTEAGAKEVNVVRAGATLVCCIGATIGKVGIAQKDSAFNQQLNAVVWGNHISDNYGYEVMRFFKPTIISWGASTTLPILKKSSFEQIEIPVPPVPLQELFTDRLKHISNLKGLHKSALLGFDNLFNALQSRAFAGEL